MPESKFFETRKIKLVIFDLDGTLINAYAAVEQSVNYVLKRLGCPPAGKERIVRSVGWGERNLLARFVPSKKLDRAQGMYRRHHAAALKDGSRLLPGARRALNYLKKERYLIGVASNRATRFSRLVLVYLGIERYFDYVLCRDKVKNPKPHPEMLLKIAKRFRLAPDAAVYVGDMTLDVEAGKRAGILTVAVTTGSSTKEELWRHKPWKIAANVHDAVDCIKELNKVNRRCSGRKYKK